MKTTPVVVEDLSQSVIAVPPLCRLPDLSFAEKENRALVSHLEAGGVTTMLYGGNANFYHVGVSDFGRLLDNLVESAGANSWVIPSAGPDFGKLMDQAPLLRARAFPTAMVLPLTFPMTQRGVATGLRRFAEAFGRPIVIYLKNEGYLSPEDVRALVDDGLVSWIKYAVVRKDPSDDSLLRRLCDQVDRKLIVSGIGERPAIVHVRDFGLSAFTSGSACVAPRGSAALLSACRRGDTATAERLRQRYLPIEDLRDAHSPIRVLHEAVRLAGIANTGPMLPLLSNLDESLHSAVAAAAKALLAMDAG